MNINSPVNLFLFEEYVPFLKKWFSYGKRFGYTKKQFLKDAAIKERALLSDIISGRKKLSEKHVTVFANVLKLTGDERKYFRLLVKKDNAAKPDKKAEFAVKLADLRIKNLSIILKKKDLEYFSSWKYPVIREYLVAKRVISSPKEVVKSLVNHKLTSREVTAVLKKLVRWGMAKYDEANGRWIALEQNSVLKYDEIPHVVVKDVKRDMINTSVKAMEMLNSDERHTSMAIRSMSKKQYYEFCKRIDEFRKEFLELPTNREEEDRVVTLNIQAFPMMKFPNGEIDENS